MTRTDLIPRTTLTTLQEIFTALPPKEKDTFTKKEAILELAPVLHNALKNGYDIDDLVSMLKQHNVDIEHATLRSYLRSIAADVASTKPGRLGAKKHAQETGRKAQTPAAKAPAPAPEAERQVGTGDTETADV